MLKIDSNTIVVLFWWVMTRFIICTLFLFSFISSACTEVLEFDISESSLLAKTSHVSDLNSESECCSHESEDKDCSDDSDCCISFCSSVTLLSSKIISFKSVVLSRIKVDWCYYHKYKSPFLDPLLKPPLFS